jgi:hypothetical protein
MLRVTQFRQFLRIVSRTDVFHSKAIMMVDFIVVWQRVIFSESDLSSYEVLAINKHCV